MGPLVKPVTVDNSDPSDNDYHSDDEDDATLNLNDGDNPLNVDDGGDGGNDDSDEDNDDPVGNGAGDGIPEVIPPEPSIIDRFANRFVTILNDNTALFFEFESTAKDFIRSIKKELNFNNRKDDRAVRPYKPIDPDNSTEIQKLYWKNRKKALRIINNDSSEFCDLDPEEVADYYVITPDDQLFNTEFMIEGESAKNTIDTSPFNRVEVTKKLKSCENTSRVRMA